MADELNTQTEQPPVVAADAPAPDAAPGKDAAPESSPSDEGKGAGNEPKSSFEALTQRLKQMQEKAPAPEAKADKPEAKADGEAEEEIPGETEEERTAFKGKPAGEQIKSLRTRLRQSTRELNQMRADLEAAKPLQERAKAFDEFSGWVRSTGLSQEEVTQGLQISALMKSDPFKALEVVTPIFQELQRRAGAALPQDLQSEVESGLVSEDRAREIARLRAQNQHAQTGWQQTAAQRQQEQEQARLQNLQSAVKGAVNEAEAKARQADPDYAKKAPMVMTKVQAMFMSEGVPNTPEAAVAMYQKALKAVNDDIALIVPRKQSITPAPSNQGGNVAAQPKSSAEAIRLAALARGIHITG